MIEHSDDVLAAEGPEREALAAVDSYMDAFNRRDLAGMDAALHFPHVRIASGAVQVMDGPGLAPDDFFARFAAATGWAYSRWDYRRAVQSSRRQGPLRRPVHSLPRGRKHDRLLSIDLDRDAAPEPLGCASAIQLRALSRRGSRAQVAASAAPDSPLGADSRIAK